MFVCVEYNQRNWNQEKEIKKRVILVEKMVEKSDIHAYIVYQRLAEMPLNRAAKEKLTIESI